MSNLNVHLATPVRSDGKVRCYRHDKVLNRQVSKTLANPNRGFYSCDAPVGEDGESCNFFKWEDELELASPPTTPSRKRPASLSGDDLVKKRPITSQNTTRSPASQARYEAILRSRQPTSATPSSPSHTNAPANAAGPSASVHRPLTPPPKTEEEDWTPKTPPPSAPPPPSQSTTTPTSQKGSESSRKRYEAMLRATGRSTASATATGSTLSSPSPSSVPPPMKERAEPRRASSVLASEYDRNANSSRNEEAMHHSLGALQGGLNITENLSPAVREYMEWSNRTAAHIVDLEGRLSAAEESNSAKAERIDQLEQEINRLKALNAELEGGIH